MASTPKARSPAYVVWQDGDARSALRHAKAYVFEEPAYDYGPRVVLQLREFAIALGFSLKDTDWWAWYRHHGRDASWNRDLRLVGAQPSDFRPSLKQAKAQELQDSDVAWLSQEVTCAPNVLLLHLLDWSTRLRRGHQLSARLALGDLIAKVLVRSAPVIVEECYELPEANENLCGAILDDRQGCQHCCRLRDRLIGKGPLLATNFSEVLMAAWGKRHECKMTAVWVGSLVEGAGQLLEDALLPEHGWQSNGEGIKAPRGEKRRLRVDSEIMDSTVSNAIGAKRFRTAGQMARSGLVDIHQSSCTDVENNTMRRYWSGLLHSFMGEQQVHLSSDESVVGGEATMILAAFSSSTGRSGWFLPQVVTNEGNLTHRVRFVVGRGDTPSPV